MASLAEPKEIIESLIGLFYKDSSSEKEKEKIAFLIAKARFDCSNKLANKLNEDMSPYANKHIERKKKKNIKAHNRREDRRNGLNFEEWEQTLKYFNYECCYCGSKEKIAMDHLFPFSKGGKLTKDNTVPACKSCNSSKREKNFEKWYKKQEFYEDKRLKKIKALFN